MAIVSSAPPLTSRAVHVWRIPLQVPPETLAECQALLSEEERARAFRFRFPELRCRFSVARGCLRALLAMYLGSKDAAAVKFIYGPAGKPELDGGGLQFNLAHSGNLALATVSNEIVGIDLEQIRALDFEVVGHNIFTAEARREIAAASEEQRAATFFRHWVRNEARLKAFGMGIGDAQCPEIPVHDLAVPPAYRAALATPINNPAIVLLGANVSGPQKS